MREYLDEVGIPVVYDDRSLQEILNGKEGSRSWRERDYSSDPDYEGVNPDLFDHLDIIDKLERGLAEQKNDG